MILILKVLLRENMCHTVLKEVLQSYFGWTNKIRTALDFYLCKLMILFKKSLNILTGKLKLWKNCRKPTKCLIPASEKSAGQLVTN